MRLSLALGSLTLLALATSPVCAEEAAVIKASFKPTLRIAPAHQTPRATGLKSDGRYYFTPALAAAVDVGTDLDGPRWSVALRYDFRAR